MKATIRGEGLGLSPLGLKGNEPEARERLRAFLAGTSLGDRPALWVVADTKHVAVESVALPAPGPDLERKAADLDSAWHIRRIESELASTVFLAEAMPTASIVVGTDITNTAVMLGGTYDYLYGEAIIQHGPRLLEAPVPDFDPTHPFVRRLETIYCAVAEHIGRQAFVNTVTTLDALTTMSQLLGAFELCRELRRRPDWVVERTLDITRLNTAFYQHFYDLLRKLGHGESSAWFHTVVEGRFDCLRADFAVMISPRMFERFVIPQLCLQSESLNHCLFNMDAVEMVRFLRLLSEIPNLDGIYWNPAPRQRDLREWVETLREIRRLGLVVEVEAMDVDEACFVARALGPDGLLISLPRFASENEALAAIERVSVAC